MKDDSRKINKGDTFVANKKGVKYINDAIKKGASNIIIEENTDDFYNKLLDKLDYNFSFKLIGVTGTNGKTTISYLIYQILLILGFNCAYIGTLGFYKKNYHEKLYNTTPSLLTLYNLLKQCDDCEYVVMEVSSIGLVENRLGNLRFDYAIYTNLTQDHLDYHNSIDEYIKAKQILFQKIKLNGKCLINNDDKYKNQFLLDNDNYTYGINKSDFTILNYKYDNNTTINIEYKNNIYNYNTKLIGKFNVYNVTCVISFLMLEGFDYKSIYNSLLLVNAPKGRMERVKNIFVDYAHTPDAVLNAIEVIKEIKHDKIYVILGCGGNRDKTKRPIMGTIASHNSDYCIFTSDNPRFENELDIINDMTKDVLNNYEIIIDRKKAIIKGIEMLKNNDILLILGKGHEEYQIIKDKINHFSDIEIVKEYTNN